MLVKNNLFMGFQDNEEQTLNNDRVGDRKSRCILWSCIVWEDAKDTNFGRQNRHVKFLRVTAKITEIECIKSQTSGLKHGNKGSLINPETRKGEKEVKKKHRKRYEKYIQIYQK